MSLGWKRTADLRRKKGWINSGAGRTREQYVPKGTGTLYEDLACNLERVQHFPQGVGAAGAGGEAEGQGSGWYNCLPSTYPSLSRSQITGDSVGVSLSLLSSGRM